MAIRRDLSLERTDGVTKSNIRAVMKNAVSSKALPPQDPIRASDNTSQYEVFRPDAWVQHFVGRFLQENPDKYTEKYANAR